MTIRKPGIAPWRPRRLWASVASVSIGMALASMFYPGPGTADFRPDAPASSPAPVDAVAILDDFESGPWPSPGLWFLPPSTVPLWWPSSCQAAGGSRSLRAFGGPSLGGELPCQERPPPGAVSTVYLDLDLRGAAGASRLELYFQAWLRVAGSDETGAGAGGLFVFLLLPEAGSYRRVPVFGATGGSGQWTYPARMLDLMALTDVTEPTDVYDLRGGLWRLEWSAVAPAAPGPGDGIFIDDLTLLWEPDAALPTPSPRPTVPPTATPPLPTASPTATPVPSLTPSPTRTPVQFRHLYLPHTENSLGGHETETPGPSPTPTPLSRLFLPLLHWDD